MQAISAARTHLDTANDMADVLGAAWDAFELTRLVAHAYSRQHTGAYAMWMYTISPACDGRDVLGFAPSTPDGPGTVLRLDDIDQYTEDQAADLLADLAGAVASKLRGVRAEAPVSKDAVACVRAAEAADEIRSLLVKDE